jgi:hypothetical protein
MARSPGDLPSIGQPDSVAEKKDSKGNVIQRRYFGSDGRAAKNIDFGTIIPASVIHTRMIGIGRNRR